MKAFEIQPWAAHYHLMQSSGIAPTGKSSFAKGGARLEETLQGQEELLRELTENIHQVFFLASAKQRQVFYVSPSYEDIWGRSCESLLRHPTSWLEAVHPED